MRNNSQDSTLERNYLEKYRFLIKEYEQVKTKPLCTESAEVCLTRD